MAIFISPLAMYSVSLGVSISLDRLLLIISLIFLPFTGWVFKHTKYALIPAGILLLTVIANLLFTLVLNTSVIFSYFLALLYFVLALVVFNQGSFDIVKRAFTVWSVLFLFFSFWALYNQIVLGNLIYDPPFGGSYADAAHKRTMMGNGRLFLPYASAPFLSFVTGFIVLWCYVNKDKLVSKRSFYFLVATCCIVTLLTQSRGPIYSLILCLFLYFFYQSVIIKLSGKFLLKAAVVFGVLLVLAAINFDSIVNSRMFPDIGEIAQSRHAKLRLEALDIYGDFQFFNLVLGGGLGVIHILGTSPYSFMSYLTVLVELGVIGFVSYSVIMFLPIIFVCFRKKVFEYEYKAISVVVLNLFLCLCHLFYEYKTLVPLWIILGYLVVASLEKKEHVRR